MPAAQRQKHHDRAVHGTERIVKIGVIFPSGIEPGPKMYGSNLPITGNCWPGYAICQRIIIIKQKPKNKNLRAVRTYWIPMTLWSVEKMYFRQNPSS